MSKNQNTFIKKQKAELKKRKQKDKLEKMLERKAQPKDGSLDNMIAYVDEFGNISSTPPAPIADKKSK
ncbi:MAG: cold-shock protein [Bacteroidota bacterium]|jgi:S-adenosylmethionine hydrolase|nr:cold-shock protein [Bacteroidota bacterium]MCE2708622.1 cold-shock protein [Algoriphagus sp.]